MIDITEEENIAILKLNNPPVNAICSELIDHLDKALDDIEDGDFRAVILTGKGDSFAGGADIKEMKNLTPEEAKSFSERGQNVFDRLRSLPMPVIAAVNGYALGGGMELALHCDLIIVSEDATLGQPEVGLGVIPGFGGTQLLPRMVGINKAKELIFTGKKIEAGEALDIGLANMKVKNADLMDEVKKAAKEIAKNAPIAVKLAKSSISGGAAADIVEGKEIEAEQFSKCFDTEDQKEGMEAFLDKRTPDFRDK